MKGSRILIDSMLLIRNCPPYYLIINLPSSYDEVLIQAT